MYLGSSLTSGIIFSSSASASSQVVEEIMSKHGCSKSQTSFRHQKMGEMTVRELHRDDPYWWVLDVDMAAEDLGVPLEYRSKAENSAARKRWKFIRNLVMDLAYALNSLYAGVGEECEVPTPGEVRVDESKAMYYSPQAWFFPEGSYGFSRLTNFEFSATNAQNVQHGIWITSSDPLSGTSYPKTDRKSVV